jgi:hypothetical protein
MSFGKKATVASGSSPQSRQCARQCAQQCATPARPRAPDANRPGKTNGYRADLGLGMLMLLSKVALQIFRDTHFFKMNVRPLNDSHTAVISPKQKTRRNESAGFLLGIGKCDAVMEVASSDA